MSEEVSEDFLRDSSCSPCANRHLSPYLQVPFSFQFLHISYFLLTIAAGVPPCSPVDAPFTGDTELSLVAVPSFTGFYGVCVNMGGAIVVC